MSLVYVSVSFTLFVKFSSHVALAVGAVQFIC